MKYQSVFGNFVCDKTCKPKWVTGKGIWTGYKIKLCNKHQVIHDMKPIKSKGE
jgi:hypothetical protein